VTTHRSAASVGRFITFEGPDGSGKTSQARLLHAALVEAGIRATLTREPGGTATGERIRDVLLAGAGAGAGAAAGTGAGAGAGTSAGAQPNPRTDALLFNAARAQLVEDVVRPALDRGEVVVSGRFADSTIAYQGHAAGIPIDDLRSLERFSTGGLEPDLTFLLDLPVEMGLARKAGAEITRFEVAYDRSFHERVRAGFLAIAAAAATRVVVLDATEPAERVFERVVSIVAERFAELAEPLLSVVDRADRTERADRVGRRL